MHDVPDLYAYLVPTLASKVSKVLYEETPNNDFTGNFYPVWVRIDVRKTLKNIVSMIQDLDRQIYKVKYERLPDWCAVCGHLGHVFKEHGDGVHPPSSLIFKDLRASLFMSAGRGLGGGRGRGRTNSGGCGGAGSGPGDGLAEIPPGQEGAKQKEVGLDVVMRDAGPSRKHGSELTAPVSTAPTLPLHAARNALPITLPAITPSPSSKHDPKKARTASDRSNGRKGSSLAASHEEDHRAQ